MNIEILYEDDDYIAVNKPAPMLVHRTPGDKDTINLLKCVKEQTGHYLYPIHRLDKQVSGVIIFGLNPQAVRNIQAQWHTDDVKKEYYALVKGKIEKEGEFNFALHDENKVAKEALTLYKPIELFPDATLVDIEIKTGRYHQIRRHFSRRMQQVIGDRRYGKKINNDFYKERFGLQRLFLHSHTLSFTHPVSHKQIQIHAPLALDLQNVLEKIKTTLCE